MTIVIDLPWPHKDLSPNGRKDRREVAGLRREQRVDAYIITKAATGRSWVPPVEPELTLKFFPPDYRKRDIDNMLASMKSALDGIADAIGIDDSKWALTLRRGEPVKGGRVLIHIEAYQPDDYRELRDRIVREARA